MKWLISSSHVRTQRERPGAIWRRYRPRRGGNIEEQRQHSLRTTGFLQIYVYYMDMILRGHLVHVPLPSLLSANQSAPAGLYRGQSGWDVLPHSRKSWRSDVSKRRDGTGPSPSKRRGILAFMGLMLSYGDTQCLQNEYTPNSAPRESDHSSRLLKKKRHHYISHSADRDPESFAT